MSFIPMYARASEAFLTPSSLRAFSGFQNKHVVFTGVRMMSIASPGPKVRVFSRFLEILKFLAGTKD